MSTAEVTAIATRQLGAMSLASAALTIQEIVAQKQLIAQAMKELMKDGEHYGLIPGAKKPSLWKPGADLICSLFQLDADYIAEEVIHEPGYIYYRFKCVLKHIPSDRRVGAGIGSCNSREESFQRAAPKKCPNCNKETIFKSKNDGEGWFCWAKKGGCGAKFKAGDPAIEQQDSGIPDPSDLDNAILKRATKRARIDAVLTATGASDFFTQDAEDLGEKAKRLFGLGVIDMEPEPTSPDDNQRIRDAIGDPPAPKGAPSAAAPATAATISKPARANTVKHDGTFASHKQVALLHVLKSKLGLPDCKGGCAVTTEKTTKWGKPPTKVTTRCPYHTQLAAFKDCDGRLITTSKDLSEAQISNLIDRYEAKLQQQTMRAAETPDLGAIDAATEKQIDELSMAIAGVDDSEKCAELICETLKVMSIADLQTKDRVSAALAIAMAYGTNALEPLLAKIGGKA